MSKNLFDLTGKNAVITGSSRGIGKAIAAGFAAHGANVIISSRKAPACEAAAAEINAAGGGKAYSIPANIGSKEEVEELIRASREVLGQIDILVCNAASNPHFGPMGEITDEAFTKIFRNNVLSNHWLSSMVAPEMIARKKGSIILISSIGGLRGSSGIGAYNVSKAADFQLARNLALEFGPFAVRVNCIAPGIIQTDFAKALWEDEVNHAKALQGMPMGRIGQPEEIAGAAVFLASDASSYVTGQAIIVDGGATITLPGI